MTCSRTHSFYETDNFFFHILKWNRIALQFVKWVIKLWGKVLLDSRLQGYPTKIQVYSGQIIFIKYSLEYYCGDLMNYSFFYPLIFNPKRNPNQNWKTKKRLLKKKGIGICWQHPSYYQSWITAVDAKGDSSTHDLLLPIITAWGQSIQLCMFYGGRMQPAYYFKRCSEADDLLFVSECPFSFLCQVIYKARLSPTDLTLCGNVKVSFL